MSPPVLACLLALAIAVFAVSAARTIACRRKQLDRAHERGGGPAWRPIPRVGGAGVVVAVTLAAALAAVFGALDLQRTAALLVPALLAFAVGFADDIRAVAAARKLGAMLVAGALAWVLGCRFQSVPVLEIPLPAWASLAATSMWFAALGAAFDFVDGLDGLAAGLGVIGAALFGVVAVAHGDLATAAVAASIGGALIGFWHHNRHPATIFLGDGGALLVGALMGGVSINVAEGTHATTDLVVLAGLAWPLLDLVIAVGRRAKRRALFRPDAEHLHHRLLARHGHAAAVVRIHVVASGCAVSGLLLVDARLAVAAALLGASVTLARGTTAVPNRLPAPGNAA